MTSRVRVLDAEEVGLEGSLFFILMMFYHIPSSEDWSSEGNCSFCSDDNKPIDVPFQRGNSRIQIDFLSPSVIHFKLRDLHAEQSHALNFPAGHGSRV